MKITARFICQNCKKEPLPNKKVIKANNLSRFRTIEKCFLINVLEGDGKSNPMREVMYFHNLDGELIAKVDPLLN